MRALGELRYFVFGGMCGLFLRGSELAPVELHVGAESRGRIPVVKGHVRLDRHVRGLVVWAHGKGGACNLQWAEAQGGDV